MVNIIFKGKQFEPQKLRGNKEFENLYIVSDAGKSSRIKIKGRELSNSSMASFTMPFEKEEKVNSILKEVLDFLILYKSKIRQSHVEKISILLSLRTKVELVFAVNKDLLNFDERIPVNLEFVIEPVLTGAKKSVTQNKKKLVAGNAIIPAPAHVSISSGRPHSAKETRRAGRYKIKTNAAAKVNEPRTTGTYKIKVGEARKTSADKK